MTRQFLTISKEFLDEKSYEQLHHNSVSLNKKYGELCDLLKGTFRQLSHNRVEMPPAKIDIGFR